MKQTKRIIACFAAVLLLLPLAGCLVPKNGDTAPDTTQAPGPVAVATATNQTGNAGTEAFDPEAIAIELGSIKITAEEMQTLFDQYVSMFSSYGSSMDQESIDGIFRMSEEWLIEYYLPLWKAEQLGIALPAEEETEILAEAERSVDEERNELLCMFAAEAGVSEDPIEDASVLNDEQLSEVIDAINDELHEIYGEGYSFDDYLAARSKDYVTSIRIERITKLLKEQVPADQPMDSETLDLWYNDKLEEQKAKYTSSPEEFYYDASDSTGETLILYHPAGYARVQVIEFLPNGEPDDKIESNTVTMQELEAEYGTLALNGGSAKRIEEIETEYAALKAEKEALEKAFYGEILEKSAAAYEALNSGLSFEDAMETYNVANPNGSKKDERLVYLDGVDTHNAELANIAKTLMPGTYSKPILIDGAYVIIKLVERIPEGAVDRASIEDAIRTAAEAERTSSAWEEQLDAWLEEATKAAVYHRETYSMLGNL